MALTRALLKAFNLTDEQISTIIEAHTDMIKGLQDSLKTAEEQAVNYTTVKKELDELKKANAEDYKTKYETEKKAFEDYKNEISAKETKAAKEAAVKAYFESKGISGKNLNAAMRGASKEIAEVEIENGKIKNKTVLDDLLKGDFEIFITKESVMGADTPTPPANTGGSTFEKMTLADKMKFANEHPNDEAVKTFLGG